MKFFIPVLFVLTPLLCQSQKTQKKNSKTKNLHSSINVAGVNISSAEGSLSYSIGQIYYSSHYEEEIATTGSPKCWDTNVAYDFDGEYWSLSGAPEIYTQEEVDTTFTTNFGFSAMQVGKVNLEAHDTTLTVNRDSSVIINVKTGGYNSIGNDEIYTGGIIRKIANNSYIIL